MQDSRGSFRHSLSVDERLDIESQSWADTRDVLAIDLLEDSGFTGIVETTTTVLRKLEAQENNKPTGTGSAFLSPSGGSSL